MKILFLLFTFLSGFCIAQISSDIVSKPTFEYPVYPSCKKFKTDNEKLKNCFLENLSYDLRNLVDNQGFNYFENNIEQKKTEIIFTIDKNGELSNLSYTTQSDELLAKDLLRRLLKTWKYYTGKKKPILPAKLDGNPIDFTIRIPVSIWFGGMH